MRILVLNLLNGLSYGTILFLLASGLSIILGLMGILNLAHGALFMVGAYVGWTLAVFYGLNFWLAALGAGVITGLLGVALERGFLRTLHRQPGEQALLTFGFVLIFTNLTQWLWGPVPRGPYSPASLSGTFHIVGQTYPVARIAIILIGIVLAIGLWWLQDKTRLGAMVRASIDDKQMTMGLGVNVDRVSTTVFFFGAFLAGFAGVIGAQLFGVYLEISLEVLLLALVVVVIGGLGSVQGALLGGMLIGLIDAFGKALFPSLAMFTIYLAMIIILLVRPSGLLGKGA